MLCYTPPAFQAVKVAALAGFLVSLLCIIVISNICLEQPILKLFYIFTSFCVFFAILGGEKQLLLFFRGQFRLTGTLKALLQLAENSECLTDWDRSPPSKRLRLFTHQFFFLIIFYIFEK
jgi:hypothetical protein